MNACDICKQYACNKKGTAYPAMCHCEDPVHAEAQRIYEAGGEDQLIFDAANAALATLKMAKTRAEKTMVFARNMGWNHIGVAFCLLLADEANIFCSILRDNGFEVESVVCKTGSLPSEITSASGETKYSFGTDAACNPIAQAMLMNEAGTELNVILGLCVGHDTLFIRHSEAPITCLATKEHCSDHHVIDSIRAMAKQAER